MKKNTLILFLLFFISYSSLGSNLTISIEKKPTLEILKNVNRILWRSDLKWKEKIQFIKTIKKQITPTSKTKRREIWLGILVIVSMLVTFALGILLIYILLKSIVDAFASIDYGG